LTEAGDIVAVPTPGHTPGHLSIIVRTSNVSWFLAGDASYTEEMMVAGNVDGVASNDEATRDTLRRIRDLAAQEPLVYLPTHDPESHTRLERQQVVAIRR
jgi:glyoxylase-like metal-dependent hydrolase (beta-lactamase superfamily II)